MGWRREVEHSLSGWGVRRRVALVDKFVKRYKGSWTFIKNNIKYPAY
jgi:hypothetical protein